MKKQLFTLASLVLAMTLVGCGGTKESSKEPAKSSETPSQVSSADPTPSSQAPASSSQAPASSQTPASSSKAPASSSQAPASSSKTPASSSQAPASSSQAPTTACAVTGVDIVVENNKSYIKINGTISGFANADAMKMAFGLVSKQDDATGSVAGNWIMGKETPEAADYKYAPQVNGGNFELKVDVSEVTFAGGVYTIMAGPQGHYGAVSLGQGAAGKGDAKVNGYRIYIRSDLGAIAADKLPPIALTDSYVALENGKVYHYIGGELGITENEFNAINPILLYETTVGGWAQTKMDQKNPSPISKVVKDGKGYIKCDVTSLGIDRYNVKLGLNGGTNYPDTQMDTIIDTSADAIDVCGKKFYVYADKTKAGDKSGIYGNLGLVVEAGESGHVGVPVGDKVGHVQNVECPCGNAKGFELHTDAMTSGQVPDLTNNNTRLGKGTAKADVWDITGVPSGEYEIHLYCAGKDAGTLDSHWDGRIDVAANPSKAGDHGGDKAGYRYTFKVNDGAYVEPTTTKTMRETGMTMANTGKYGLTESLGTIMIPENSTRFEIKNMDNGYASFIEGIQLIRVGAYQAPAKNVVFSNHEMLIEGEDFSMKHTIFTNTGEETSYTTNGQQYPVSLNGEVVDDSSASGGKYVGPIFREGWDNNKRSNMSGEVVYRINVTSEVILKVKAKIKSDMETEKVCFDLKVDGQGKGTLNAANTWVEVESAAITLAPGIHTISFVGQQLGSNEGYRSVLADLDCFTLVEQVA